MLHISAATSILNNCWQNHYTVYADGRELFGVKVSKLFAEAQTDNIPIAQLTTSPWVQLYRSLTGNIVSRYNTCL